MSFKDFIEKKRSWYKTIGKVYCPALKEDVMFNSKGFYHLRYHHSGKTRSPYEQAYKMNLLPLVPMVIEKAKKVHDYKKELTAPQSKKSYEIWELREFLEETGRSVSVVLRRIGNGKVVFLSVWKNKRSKSRHGGGNL